MAALFEKRHDHVLRDIGALLAKAPDLGSREFTQTNYQAAPKNGESFPANTLRNYLRFDMTRDGFVLLAMGFNGERALKFKRAYIQAFNTQEANCYVSGSGARITAQTPQALR